MLCQKTTQSARIMKFPILEKNHHTRSGSYNALRGGAIFAPRGMIGRIYVELHMTLLHIKYTTFVSCGCRVADFFMYFHHKSMVDNDMPGACPVWTPGARLADHYTLLHTKYESSGPYGFGEEDFFLCFSHCKSMGANDPSGQGHF